MEEIPKTLDWVRVRAECSLHQMFIALREVIDSDVKSIQARDQRVQYKLMQPADGKLVVSRTRNDGGIISGESVVFELIGDQAVRVKEGRTEQVLFSVKPTVTSTGECKFHVDGESLPLYAWQVSRKALESLFFR